MTVAVIGGGPGGYAAAFRAADLGLDVVLVERDTYLGGVCLNVGCIPSKALLHAARVIAESEEAAEFGIAFGRPTIDVDRLREWKGELVEKLANGLGGLAGQRGVKVVTGEARFGSPHMLQVGGDTIEFEHCVIAAGSRPATFPGLPADERIGDSTMALELRDVPDRLLVIGGGIVGLEMATAYAALGSSVSVVELAEQLIPGCDPDLVRPLQRRLKRRFETILLGTAVTTVEATTEGIQVGFDSAEAQVYDRVLVAIGRRANGDRLGAEHAGVGVDPDGVIWVDSERRTEVPHIFAVGDVTGTPMLAHKATHEGKVAAEVIAGLGSGFGTQPIPSVAYTDPEIAWSGLTERSAQAGSVAYDRASFPWQASGRAASLGRAEGLTKVLVDPDSRVLLGVGIVGPDAGELIAEATLAIAAGLTSRDVAQAIHPHPTLSETVGLSAEMAEGTITDLYVPQIVP